MYFQDGEYQLHFDPGIGSPVLEIKKLGSEGEGPDVLKKNITSEWLYNFNVDQSGCYIINLKPGGELNYFGGKFSVLSEKNILLSCELNKPSNKVRAGEEKYMKMEEIKNTHWKSYPSKITKKIGDLGTEYCETEFTLKKGQKVFINVEVGPDDSMLDFVLKKEDQNSISTVLNDTQYDLSQFGFVSLTGGEYTLQFMGRSVFSRLDDVEIFVD